MITEESQSSHFPDKMTSKLSAWLSKCHQNQFISRCPAYIRRQLTSIGANTSVDSNDVQKFENLSGDWWLPNGPMKALHSLNDIRSVLCYNSCIYLQSSYSTIRKQCPLHPWRFNQYKCCPASLREHISSAERLQNPWSWLRCWNSDRGTWSQTIASFYNLPIFLAAIGSNSCHGHRHRSRTIGHQRCQRARKLEPKHSRTHHVPKRKHRRSFDAKSRQIRCCHCVWSVGACHWKSSISRSLPLDIETGRLHIHNDIWQNWLFLVQRDICGRNRNQFGAGWHAQLGQFYSPLGLSTIAGRMYVVWIYEKIDFNF